MRWRSAQSHVQACCWCVWVLALLSLGCSSCVRGVKIPTFPNHVSLAPQKGAKAKIRVAYYAQDHRFVPYVIDALQQALKASRVWGGLRAPMTVRIFPTHRSLEEAVLRNYAWLRAWALFHEVYLQSPRTWRMRYFHSALSELLVHELTHVVMYQQCCQLNNWRRQTIPFWFREGMASYTARQERRRWSMERLALFGRSPKGRRILKRPERYLVGHQPVAYSLAHWKFVYMIKAWGVKGVKRLLALMRKGKSFSAAFKAVAGITTDAFDTRFMKQLRKASMVGQGPRPRAGHALASVGGGAR